MPSMRRRAGSSSPGRTAGRAAGVIEPRPRTRFVWGVAVSVLVHGLVWAGMVWHKQAPPETARAQRMSLRLVSRPAAVVTAPAPPVAKLAKLPQRTAPRALPKPAEPPVVTAPTPVVEPISGAVFGMPRIAFSGMAPSSRAAAPPPRDAMPPPGPSPHAQALAMREAGRAQIMFAMQQQVAQWQTPSADGSCALLDQPANHLECDSEVLQQIVELPSKMLVGMLAAYRGVDPSAGRLAITFSQGRYELTLVSAGAQRTGANVTSMPRDVTVTAPGL
jgi:hypothetical protein